MNGPVKGSYAIIYASDDLYSYVSDFGMRVDDPCKAQDDDLYINLTPGFSTVKDLKYHTGTHSYFWLPQCSGLLAFRLTKGFSFIELNAGKLSIHSKPHDICTEIAVEHKAPDDTIFTNIFFLKMLDKYTAHVEKCTP